MGAYYSASRIAIGAALGVLTRWKVRGSEHVPRVGGVVVASNHISFLDPPLVGAAIPREVHFLAKEELFRTPVLGRLIRTYHAIPIRRGVADLSGLWRAVEVLRAGGALLMFPEGSRMRDGRLHPARPGVGLMAVQADVPVVPCHISGSNRTGRWWLGGGRVRITFAPARPWRELVGPETDLTPGRALYRAVGEGIMRLIAALRAAERKSASPGAA